jgi:hypothetical protein
MKKNLSVFYDTTDPEIPFPSVARFSTDNTSLIHSYVLYFSNILE